MVINNEQKLVIIGSGPAGLTAALYAARAGLEPLVLTGPSRGGQLLKTSSVNNWPGLLDIPGPALIHTLQEHALMYPCTIREKAIASVSLHESLKRLTLQSGEVLTTRALIIACGTTARRLTCLDAEKYYNHGISNNLPTTLPESERPWVILGGGNSAIGFAYELLERGCMVTIIHEKESLTGSDPRRLMVSAHPNVTFLFQHTITAVDGQNGWLTAIRAHDLCSGQDFWLETQRLIVATGAMPNSHLFASDLALLPSGHIAVTPGTTETSVAGVFAAGDVCDNRYRHAITSAGQGAMAALDAERFLNGKVVVRFF